MKRLLISGLLFLEIGCGIEPATTAEDATSIATQSAELQAAPNYFACRAPEQCLCGMSDLSKDQGELSVLQCGPNRICCLPPPPPPPPPLPPPPSPVIFKSSVGLGGTGSIRDLKFEKGDSSNQSPLDGYILIPADLNKGAGGTYIYLTFTRDPDKVQGYDNFCGNLTPADHVTHILADDFSVLAAASAKRQCRGGLNFEWSEPIFEETGAGGLHDWKHPDLNDGAGGRFIYAWQSKLSGYAAISEVGVVSSSAGDVSCPAGWARVEQELNQGAGGDWIYFCYQR